MKRENYLFTIERNGIKITIMEEFSHPLMFLAIEKELGYNTFILYSKVLNLEEYQYYHNTLK